MKAELIRATATAYGVAVVKRTHRGEIKQHFTLYGNGWKKSIDKPAVARKVPTCQR